MILPVEKPETEDEALACNNMFERHSQTLDVTIRFPAGHYQEKSLVQTLNKALHEQEQLKAYYEGTQYTLSNRLAASYRRSPEFHDSQGRTIFSFNQDDVKYIEMNRELAFMSGFAVNAKHGPERIPIHEN